MKKSVGSAELAVFLLDLGEIRGLRLPWIPPAMGDTFSLKDGFRFAYRVLPQIGRMVKRASKLLLCVVHTVVAGNQ
ncbi:hypothetical protein [Levilactobacillus sp. HBUAS70063]|uniref:hypothetical protein n=1 Tax=Levilactobacillus sp. HBUAS70063 TaxID=3109359 RepID=UPI003132BD13